MNERTTTDTLLESMLEARAAGAVPSDLRREVVAAALAEIPAGRRRTRLAGERTSGSPLRLLAIAAVIGTAAVGALVAGGALRDDRTPSDPATVVVPVTSPRPAASDAPDAPTLIRCVNVPADGYAERDMLPIPTYPFAQVSSDIVTVGGRGLVLTPGGSPAGAPRSIPLTTMPPTLTARGLGVSPDGRWITIDTVGRRPGTCGYPVLVSAIDGSLLRPFTAGGAESVGLPVWSPDGRTLYAIHRTLATGPLVSEDRGSVWAWDRAANTVASLGAPCDGCGVVAVIPRPDGRGLAASYTETGCDPNGYPSCASGIAVHGETGWRIVATPAQLAESLGTEATVLEPLGVTPDDTFALKHVEGAIALVPLEAAGAPVLIGRPCCTGLSAVSLSPDASTIAGVVMSEDGLDGKVVLLDLVSQAWSTAGTISHRPDEQADGDWPRASAWAPDGSSIAFMMDTKIGRTVLRIVRPDEGSIEDVAIEGIGGWVLTWLPSMP